MLEDELKIEIQDEGIKLPRAISYKYDRTKLGYIYKTKWLFRQFIGILITCDDEIIISKSTTKKIDILRDITSTKYHVETMLRIYLLRQTQQDYVKKFELTDPNSVQQIREYLQ